MEKILVTVALPYLNGLPHVGHIAGSHLPADIYNRFNKSFGKESYMIGGADAHGTPIVVTSKKLNLDIEMMASKLKELHSKIYKKLNIGYDIFSTTHTQTHINETQKFFTKLLDNGYISTKTTTRLYCTDCKSFLADRFVEGTCPYCGHIANGDECENCCHTMTAQILKDPKCKSCGKTPILKDNEEIFLELPKLQKEIDAFVESKRNTWRPTVFAEAKRLVNEGLNARSISRDISWGIPANLKGFENRVFYIWFEAPIGYLSITKELSEQLNKDLYREFWVDKNENNKIVHFVGKDNIQFHSVFFPSMIIGNKGFNNADNLAGNMFLNFEGQKISKSKNVGIFMNALLREDFNVDIDILRAYLTSVIPEFKDTEWTWDGLKQNTNAELANKLGNFFNRVISMTNSYLSGEINCDFEKPQNDLEQEAYNALLSLPKEIAECFEKIEIRDGYKKVLQLASAGNIFLEKSAPWNMFKEGKLDEVKRVLYLAINIARSVAICFAPICPTKMTEFWQTQLNLTGSPLDSGIWKTTNELQFKTKHTVNKPAPLFPRWDEAKFNEVKEQLLNSPELIEYLK